VSITQRYVFFGSNASCGGFGSRVRQLGALVSIFCSAMNFWIASSAGSLAAAAPAVKSSSLAASLCGVSLHLARALLGEELLARRRGVAVLAARLDRLERVAALGHLAVHRVLPVERGRRPEGEEELAAVRVRVRRASGAERAGLGVLHLGLDL